MNSTPQQPAEVEETLTPQQFADAENSAYAYLAADFTRIQPADRQNIVQDTLLALVEKSRAGEDIGNPSAWAVTAADFRARTLVNPDRNWQEATDHTAEDDVLAARASAADAILEGLVDREGLAAVADVARYDLPAEQRDVLELFTAGFKQKDGAKRLGISRPTYCNRLAKARLQLASVLDNPGRLSHAKLTLVSALLTGVASRAERKRAQTLMKQSPSFAAEYARQKRLLTGAGLLLPPSVLAPSSGGGILAALGNLLSGLRDKLPGGDGGAAGATSSTAASGSGGGGLLAAGVGGKVAAGCAVVLCAGGGGLALRGNAESGEPEPPARERGAVNSTKTAAPALAPAPLAAPADPRRSGGADGDASNGGAQSKKKRDGGKPGHPDREPAATSDPAGAGAAADEFDPLAAPPASTPTPTPPAPTPPASSSGGSSSGGGSGGTTDGSIAGSEFGP